MGGGGYISYAAPIFSFDCLVVIVSITKWLALLLGCKFKRYKMFNCQSNIISLRADHFQTTFFQMYTIFRTLPYHSRNSSIKIVTTLTKVDRHTLEILSHASQFKKIQILAYSLMFLRCLMQILYIVAQHRFDKALPAFQNDFVHIL